LPPLPETPPHQPAAPAKLSLLMLGAAGSEARPSRSNNLAEPGGDTRSVGIEAPGQQPDYAKRSRDAEDAIFQRLTALLRLVDRPDDRPAPPPPPLDWPASAFHATDSEPDKVAFLIALGAQGGCLTAQVDDATAKLERRFRARLGKVEKTAGTGKFNLSMPRSAQLNAYRAESFSGADGAVRSERLRFKDPGDACRVLKFAWDEYGNQMGADMTQWLIELGEHQDYDVRATAGAAAGHLAQRDFANFDHRLFEPWRRSRSMRPLDALDSGLAVAAGIALLDTAVAKRLREWADDADDIDNVLAAGFMARGVYGWKNPDAALDVLLRLLRHNRDISFGEALQGFHTWFLWGKEDETRAQRAVIALESAARAPEDISNDPRDRAYERTQNSVFQLQVCIIFLVFLGAPDQDPQRYARLAPILKSPAAAASLARLFNRCFTVRDGILAQNGITPSTREIARHLFLRASQDAKVADVMWPFFAAALRYADEAQGDTLRKSLSGWRGRAIGKGRDMSEFDRIAGNVQQ
jgi:hypothetical protein